MGSGTLGGRLGGGSFGVRSRAETGTVEADGDKKGKKMRRWLEIEEIEHTVNRGSLKR